MSEEKNINKAEITAGQTEEVTSKRPKDKVEKDMKTFKGQYEALKNKSKEELRAEAISIKNTGSKEYDEQGNLKSNDEAQIGE